jgi:aromatase
MAAHVDNEVMIWAPFDLVWELANDVERWPQLFAGEYARAEVLERDGDRVRFRLTTARGPDGAVHTWESERWMDRARGTVQARRIDPGPFRYVHIFQSFTPVAAGTLLRWVQDFEVRPGAPFTDEQARRRIDEAARANLLQHRRVIEARASGAA